MFRNLLEQGNTGHNMDKRHWNTETPCRTYHGMVDIWGRVNIISITVPVHLLPYTVLVLDFFHLHPRGDVIVLVNLYYCTAYLTQGSSLHVLVLIVSLVDYLR